ncbi:MAG: RHS repeat domain-containing protein [Terriglobales bacterium]
MATPEAGTDYFYYTMSDGVSLCAGSAKAVCRKTDARGITTTYTYDSLSRLTGRAYSNPSLMPNVCTTSPNGTAANSCNYYDQGGAGASALGRLTSIADPSGSETFTYDPGGRVTQKQKVIGGTTYPTAYQYNAGGQLTRITYPSGRVVQQNVDNVGLLNSIVSGGTTYASIPEPPTGYNAAEQLLTFTYGNGVVAAFGYSPTSEQMTSLSYVKSGTTLFSLNYYYKDDPANCTDGSPGNDGLIQCIVDNTQNPTTPGSAGRSVTYTYDALGRLSTALTAGSPQFGRWGMLWTYDQYGNRTNQTVTAGNAPSNSLTFATTPVPPANPPGGAFTNRPDGYSFDASGNMLNDGQNTLTYDDENCLISSANSFAGTSTYTCDSHGMRVVKALQGSTTTAYIFSGGKDIAEYDNGAAVNSPSREYIYLGGRLISTIQGSTILYHHSDHLSVRVTTDVSGADIGEQGHYPYGEQWYATNTTTKFFFTSYERDSDSGNDYAMARSYINRFGRFGCVDPLLGQPGDPQSWNRYAYVRNNPTNSVDPSGKGIISFLVNFFKILFSGVIGGLPGNVPIAGTPPIFSDPLGDTQATLNSIYNPTSLSQFGISNFTNGGNIECTLNVYIGSSFLLNRRGENAMLREMRRIFGGAHVGINRVATDTGADFATSLAVEASPPPGFSLADGAYGGHIPGTNIGIVSLGRMLADNAAASATQLGTAAGAVASHEIGHNIWNGQGDLPSSALNKYDIMDHGDPWSRIL